MQLDRTAILRGTLVALGLFAVTGIVTGLIPIGVFDRMVPRSPLDFGFLAMTSLLAGAYVYQRSTVTECSGDKCAYGGAASGAFAVACPHCNALLVGLFGSSWLATYVDPIRPLFGILAVGLFAGILYVRWQR